MIPAMMNRTLFFCMSALSLALAGCSLKPAPHLDGQKVLEDLGSPEVDSVAATMEKNAKAAEEVGDYRRASQVYEQLVEQDGKNTRYLLALAENSRKAGRNDVALASYEMVLKLDKGNVNALEGKALSQMAVGELDKAGDAFAEVMKKDTKRWRTLNGLAILFVMKERYDDAMAYFVESLENSPNNASVLNNVGLTMALEKKDEDAIEALKKAARLASEDNMLRRKIELNLAMVYAAKGELEKAKKLAVKYLSGPALDNNMGFYAHLAKDDVLAKSYLNMALSGSPSYYKRAWQNLDAIKKQENITTQKGKAGTGKRVKVQ